MTKILEMNLGQTKNKFWEGMTDLMKSTEQDNLPHQL